jgi:hypothetical protein
MMKRTYFLLSLFLLQILCISANAQNEGLIENFLRKVEEIQKKESSVNKN